MPPSDSFLPAPGRGQYDRSQTREQRLTEQRERLVAAATRVLASDPSASVARVVELAAVGRGTFYEYFDDVEHVRRAAITIAGRTLEVALRRAAEHARTPVERMRALASRWFDFAVREPASLLILLRERAEMQVPLSAAGLTFAAVLNQMLDELRASGMTRGARDPLRPTAAAAVAEAFGRDTAGESLGDGSSLALLRERHERALVETLVLLMR
jgi:AcrR family transcriptional regulator